MSITSNYCTYSILLEYGLMVVQQEVKLTHQKVYYTKPGPESVWRRGSTQRTVWEHGEETSPPFTEDFCDFFQ